MSLLLAKLIQTSARTANAAAHGLHRRSLMNPPKGKKKKPGAEKPGCTPCEAMARVEAARKLTRGGG